MAWCFCLSLFFFSLVEVGYELSEVGGAGPNLGLNRSGNVGKVLIKAD
jgi:hypothetical protein